MWWFQTVVKVMGRLEQDLVLDDVTGINRISSLNSLLQKLFPGAVPANKLYLETIEMRPFLEAQWGSFLQITILWKCFIRNYC